jgi:hypothetical protein
MEPRKIEAPRTSHGEGQSSLPSPPERKRLFQIVKLEERIAPGGNHTVDCKTRGHACTGLGCT